MSFTRFFLLTLTLVLATAGRAEAQYCSSFNNNYNGCSNGCDISVVPSGCDCYWDAPSNPNGFPGDYEAGNEVFPPGDRNCWNGPCWSIDDFAQCPVESGGTFNSGTGKFEGNRCEWDNLEGECRCKPPLVTIVLPLFVGDVEAFAPFDCQCPYVTHEEWRDRIEDGLPCVPPALDHFTFYKTKTSKDATKFQRFGPVVLSDMFQSNVAYEVSKPTMLGLPSNKNGEGVTDADTHREQYSVKPAKGTEPFAGRVDVGVTNQCNDLRVTVGKAVSLLVPTSKSLTDPVTAPDPLHHNVEHLLCYKATTQTKLSNGVKLPKFPKGIQVDVADQFQTRRYDLLKVTKLCTSVDKAGTPAILSGPNKGAAKPITPFTRSGDTQLLCYQARLAKKHIAQSGCGPANPADKGTLIAPEQAKHTPVLGLHVANQFGSERLDTVKEAELCIPSQLTFDLS